jgi:hypothetical protein
LTLPTDEYWDLLAQTARLQARLGDDLVAWAKMYEAGGKALRRSSGTLDEMSQLGRHMQSYLETGPPALVTQILRMFTEPWAGLQPGMGMPGAASLFSGPFAQMWETWATGLRSREPPPDAPEEKR